jgi:hypothetical protein
VSQENPVRRAAIARPKIKTAKNEMADTQRRFAVTRANEGLPNEAAFFQVQFGAGLQTTGL